MKGHHSIRQVHWCYMVTIRPIWLFSSGFECWPILLSSALFMGSPLPALGPGEHGIEPLRAACGPGSAKSQQVLVSRSDRCIVVCISVIATMRWVRNWSEQDFCFQCCPLSKLEKAINTKELKTPFPEATCGLPFALE